MDFLDALETRHSIRAYADTPVEDKKPEKNLEAANHAPPAGNYQAYEV